MITGPQVFFRPSLGERHTLSLKGLHNNEDEDGGEQKQRRFVVEPEEQCAPDNLTPLELRGIAEGLPLIAAEARNER